MSRIVEYEILFQLATDAQKVSKGDLSKRSKDQEALYRTAFFNSLSSFMQYAEEKEVDNLHTLARAFGDRKYKEALKMLETVIPLRRQDKTQ